MYIQIIKFDSWVPYDKTEQILVNRSSQEKLNQTTFRIVLFAIQRTI